jgi:hypothetical protein
MGMRTTQDSDGPRLGRRLDLGRAQSIDTLVHHRETVEQRLSFSLRRAALVDRALAEFDHQLAEIGDAGPDHALRASVRALLIVATDAEGYDATLVPDRGHLAVRVRKTLFGLQVDAVDRAASSPPSQPSHVEQPGSEQTTLTTPTPG